MKKFLIALSFVIVFCTIALAQDFKTHKVLSGETVETIAKQYMVTPFDILALNPDAKKGLSTNMVLIIPESKLKSPSDIKENQLARFEEHKVKRKETLYSISKTYDIEIDEIKKFNTFLYSKNLQRGDALKIPVYKKISSQQTLKNTLKKYTVQPKEGKWGIAYKFGITVQELEALNPDIKEVLQPGDELIVPNLANNEERQLDDDLYNYYKVEQAEGFYRLNKKLGLTQEELERLNPSLKESGLQSGMVLKVPKNLTYTDQDLNTAYVKTSVLSKELNNLSKKTIAVMLPFRLHRVDLDSVAEAKEQIKNDKLLSMSLDFHTGLLMALDSAKQLGISTDLKVFDTRSQISEINNILQKNNFELYDAVIGPVVSNNFDRVASTLQSQNIPVLAPLTMPAKLYDNVFQTLPDKNRMKQSLIDFMKEDQNAVGYVIISDSRHKAISEELKRHFPSARQMYTRKDKDGKDNNYLLLADFNGVFKPGKNIVFLETDNEAFVANVLSLLNGLKNNQISIQLTTTNVNKAFEGESASNVHLSNLNFHYASPNVPITETSTNGFVNNYKATYGVLPNKYAVRGFDITLDVLLRLASKSNMYESSQGNVETSYLENKFNYNKQVFGGYYNSAVYIVKYDNLTIIEAKQ